MSRNPASDVVDHLDSELGTLTKGTNLLVGKMREKGPNVPTKGVFVLNSGGPQMDAYQGGTGVSPEDRKYSGAQIMCRSDLNEFEEGEALIRSVRDTIHRATISGYNDVRCLETEPNYLGEAPEGFHLWTINLELWHVE